MKKILLLVILLISATCSFGQTKDSLKFDTAHIKVPDIQPNLFLNSYTLPKMYVIDWKKVKTFSDLKAVLNGLNIQIFENSTNFKKIKKYLIEAK